MLISVGADGSQSSRPNLGWPVDKSLYNFLPLLRYPLLFSSVVVVGSFCNGSVDTSLKGAGRSRIEKRGIVGVSDEFRGWVQLTRLGTEPFPRLSNTNLFFHSLLGSGRR